MAQDAQTENQQGATATELSELSEFSDMLKQTIKPRTKAGEEQVENAAVALVAQALEDQSVIEESAINTIDAMIAKLDEKLSAQMNAILHAEEYQQIESAWRGLAHQVNNSATDASYQIHVLNISKDELTDMALSYPGTEWEQSPFHQMVYEQRLGTLGG